MTNYFSLLNLPPSFAIDLNALEAAYIAAQRQAHPDKTGLQGAQLSIQINDAYRTLKDPLKRATYLLELKDVTVLDEANTTKPDMVILNEIMELQEARMEADTPEKMADFQVKQQGLIEECLQHLTEAFTQNDLDAAKTSTIRLSYLYKLSH